MGSVDLYHLMRLDGVLFDQIQSLCRSPEDFDALQKVGDPSQRLSEEIYLQLKEEGLK